MKLLLRTILLSSALCVFSLENLNFFGEYVVFTPQTKAIKFDLQNEMDVLMLDREVNATMAIDYLYRVQILMNDTDHMHENPNGTKFRGQNIYITLFKENHTMLTGSYHLWNLTEAKDVSIDWGSQQNVIQVLTTVNGNQYSIFSWKDRSKRETRVRNLGVRVSEENSTENQHTKWKLREADSKDFDIRKAYRMCDIRLLAEHPNSFNSNNNINSTNSSNSTNSTNSSNSSNSTNSINSTNTTNSNKPIYEIFISREQDEKFTVSLYKNSTEKAYVKTDRMDSRNIYVTWDNDTGLIMLGMKNELTPLLMWQDTTSKINNDLGRVKFVTIVQYTSGRQHSTTTDVKKDTFKTIPDFYPKYFTNSSTLIVENPQSTTESARKSKTRSFDVTDEDLRELVLSDEEDLVE